MGFASQLLAGFLEAFHQAVNTPARVWMTIIFISAAAYFTVRIALLAAMFIRSYRRGKPHNLSIKVDEGEGRKIWMNAQTRRNLNLTNADHAIIRSSAAGRGYVVEVLARRAGMGRDPGENAIAITSELKNKLFSLREDPDGETREVYIWQQTLNGFSAYWLNPNSQTRFANRLALYLGLGVPLFQLLLDWGR